VRAWWGCWPRRQGKALSSRPPPFAPAKPPAITGRRPGPIHAQQGDYLEAVKAYNRALELSRDAEGLYLRGRAYLKMDAARPALADFSAALDREPGFVEARCGRALALARLGLTEEATAEMDAALKHGPRTAGLLLSAACVYGRAAAAGPAERPRLPDRPGGRHAQPEWYWQRDRAAGLVREALEQTTPAEREAFWRDHVQNEPALALVRGAPAMRDLEKRFGR
jgi:tetratricopeptide (TPR) repeat protein